MNNKQESIKQLQYLVSALSAGALNHEIHGHIFASQGFEKLGDKYKAHAQEEREFVAKFINRIIDLGGKVQQGPAEAAEVFEDFEAYLKHDLEVQVKGVEYLGNLVKPEAFDIATYDILKEYYLDEEEDLYWSQQQVELIERIGLQNYLAKQL